MEIIIIVIGLIVAAESAADKQLEPLHQEEVVIDVVPSDNPKISEIIIKRKNQYGWVLANLSNESKQ